MLILSDRNVGNFSCCTRDSKAILTPSAWAAIITSCAKVLSYDLYLKKWCISPHAFSCLLSKRFNKVNQGNRRRKMI